jgi:hypothetical protein
MVLATYRQGSVNYPTGVYEKYNLYLIKEYEKLYIWFDNKGNNENAMKLVLREITDLNYLLSENTSNDITKIFNVMGWEEELSRSYRLLDRTRIYNNMEPLVKIKTFMRREKLKKIKKAS